MMIELFGPPGVGKTTFAAELANRLRQLGCDVELVVSFRPAEVAATCRTKAHGHNQFLDIVQRLMRPAREIFHATIEPGGQSPEARTASNLLKLLPPESVFWAFRLRQYILRLSRSWQASRPDERIVIYDQAFVQAVCSLVLLSEVRDHERVVRAVEFTPVPDLLVQLDAPRQILEARLTERERQQGRLERILEFNLATNLRSIDVVDQLRPILVRQGRPVMRLASGTRQSLHESVDTMEYTIMHAYRENLVA